MSRRRQAPRPPRHPFWKDEKILGGVSVAATVRAFVGSVVLALAVIAGAMIFFHHNRVETDRNTDRKIHDLVCLVVKDARPDGGLGDQLRHQYHCPPYRGRPIPRPSPDGVP